MVEKSDTFDTRKIKKGCKSIAYNLLMVPETGFEPARRVTSTTTSKQRVYQFHHPGFHLHLNTFFIACYKVKYTIRAKKVCEVKQKDEIKTDGTIWGKLSVEIDGKQDLLVN